MVSFDGSDRLQDAEIQKCSDEIRAIFATCKTNIIQMSPKDISLDVDDRRIIRDAMQGMAMKLRAEVNRFCEANKRFIRRFAHPPECDCERHGNSGSPGVAVSEVFGRGLTAEQVVEMERIRNEDLEREALIGEVSKSIDELANVFSELNLLFVDQRSILDRIDFNLSQTANHVSAGNRHCSICVIRNRRAQQRRLFMMVALFAGIVVVSILIGTHHK
eukprot:TRINITY_DN164_c0_g1_i2.p1 TRINITY_DN164_c0_g1~~TRINITY_DN164_c0_g1_i2.p1  ORF type:complete len:218 (-),score=45.42 TRINITY_DN164_c0_g1_i2:34-687(-)